MEIYVWSCHLAEYTLIHCHLTLWKNYFFLGKESTFFPFENKSICYFLINVYCSSVISTYCACRQAGNAVPPPMGRAFCKILKLFFSIAGCEAVKFCVNFYYFKVQGAFIVDLWSACILTNVLNSRAGHIALINWANAQKRWVIFDFLSERKWV